MSEAQHSDAAEILTRLLVHAAGTNSRLRLEIAIDPTGFQGCPLLTARFFKGDGDQRRELGGQDVAFDPAESHQKFAELIEEGIVVWARRSLSQLGID